MTRKHSTKFSKTGSAEKTVKDIPRATRKHYGAEEKIRIIVLKGLRGEHSIAELCRIEGINSMRLNNKISNLLTVLDSAQGYRGNAQITGNIILGYLFQQFRLIFLQ